MQQGDDRQDDHPADPGFHGRAPLPYLFNHGGTEFTEYLTSKTLFMISRFPGSSVVPCFSGWYRI
jgi:hypothetical protein